MKNRVFFAITLLSSLVSFAQSSGPAYVNMMFDTSNSVIYPLAANRYVTNNSIINQATNDIAGLQSDLSEFKGNVDSGFTDVYWQLSGISNSVFTNSSRIADNQQAIEGLADVVSSNALDISELQTNLFNEISRAHGQEEALTNSVAGLQQDLSDEVARAVIQESNLFTAVSSVSNKLGITVYGATNAAGSYIEFTNTPALEFDKESGFTVVPTGTNSALRVSLGSAWTTLVPDIHQINPETGEYYPDLRPSGEETIRISVTNTEVSGTFWDYSNTNKNEKTFLIGINIGANGVDYTNVFVSDTITVSGIPYPIGQYTNGSVIESNTPISTVFSKMFRKTVPPVYNLPSMSVSVSGLTKNETYEYGTLFWNPVPVVSASVTRRDAGAIVGYAYYTNGILVASNETSSVSNSQQINDFYNLQRTTTVAVQAYYGEGPIKTNSDGVLDPVGHVMPGNLSDSFSVHASRYLFYGTKTTPVIVDSPAAITNLPFKNFVTKVSSLTIPLPIRTRQVLVALPCTARVNSIRFKNNFVDEDITASVSTNIVFGVNCLNGWSYDDDGGRTYIVYDYTSPGGSPEDNVDTVVFNITP